MSEKTKKAWKIVGIVAGVLLLIGGTVGFFVWRNRNKDGDESDENPYVTKNTTSGASSSTSSSSGSGSSSSQSYSKEEIKKMQSWLLSRGIFHFNTTVINAIQSTGGIDGVIGPGFNKALAEAIKQGWVMGMLDLYNKAISK